MKTGIGCPEADNKDQEKKKRDYIKQIQRLRPIDDGFFRLLFRDNLFLSEYVLRIVLKEEKLTLKTSVTQADLKQLPGHRSLELDLMAQDILGRYINLEIQRKSEKASPKRVRYHASILDWKFLQEKDAFQNLPETYIIFLTEKDYYGLGLSVYHVDRHVVEKQYDRYQDEEHVLYVNGSYRGTDALGQLMHDFNCSDPEEMYHEPLKERVQLFKTTEEGRKIMVDVFEEVREEGKAEGKAEGKTEGILRDIRALKETMNMTNAEAMKALNIPANEQKVYLRQL